MRALVVSGGTSVGPYEAGLVYALSAEERFDIVCGSSIGAFNAVALAQGRREELHTLWSSIAQHNLTQLRPEIAAFQQLFESVRRFRTAPLPNKPAAALKVLAELRCLPEARAVMQAKSLFPWDPVTRLLRPMCRSSELCSALFLSATNLSKMSAATFYAFPPRCCAEMNAFAAAEPAAIPLTDENYLPAILASAALPVAFEPVWMDDADGSRCAFADGCIANDTPLRQAIDAGATDVTVSVKGHPALGAAHRTIANLADVFFASTEVALDRILELDLRVLRSVNERVLLGKASTKRFVGVRVIGPSLPLPVEGFGFDDQASVDRMFELGARDGQAALRVSSQFGERSRRVIAGLTLGYPF
jgi:predicted acylesterase/phospholipase RssA